LESYNGISNEDLVTRYASNYNLKRNTINIDMVMQHWNLEKALTKQLLSSTPHNRKKVFQDAYNKLYKELTWLVKTHKDVNPKLLDAGYTKNWLPLFNDDIRGKRIYEIGSGNGDLISFLAISGAFCTATEISDERPSGSYQHNLEWHNTDGVNLREYEPSGQYDYVISDQVIEHLHPDDIDVHFNNVFHLLQAGGKYIFYTPHYYIGPGDVSLVFGTLEAEGMHLKEYKYYEIYKILKASGFKKIMLPVNFETSIKMLPVFWFKIFLLLEKSLMLFSSIRLRKRIYHRLIKPFQISNQLVLIAEK
jgi:SAM-dependent methyltransferase